MIALRLLLCLGAAVAVGKAAAGQTVVVVGTEFRLTQADGRVLTGAALIGRELSLADPPGPPVTVRIDAVRPDPMDPAGEITLYGFSIRDPATGEWHNRCRAGPNGFRMGFPLRGHWTPAGAHVPSETRITLSCTTGVLAKCVRLGYKPWKRAPDGTSLRPYHQACTRLLRADYCGDGIPHTRAGTAVYLYDRLGIRPRGLDPPPRFEAAWGPDGAVCVHRVRVPERATLDALALSCPGRLAGKVGTACTERSAARSAATLLMNRSN